MLKFIKNIFRPSKHLKSLDSKNAEYRSGWDEFLRNEPKPNGIVCPDCGEELLDTNPFSTITTNPPQKHIHCPKCGYSGYRIC